ncbi:WD40-repeat-containing domain protein [Melanogaster broomeanus]|nr:WD40-repeat-containing domain protein [Melanogaster broomeanus]
MPYEVEFENGTGFRVDDLAFDGSNWTTYHEELIYVAKLEGVVGQFDGTDAPPVAGTEAYQEWSFRNSVATMLVTFTIPDSLLINFYDTKTAQEIFMQLENRFSKSTTPSPTLSTPTRESRQKRDTSNHKRRRKVERDRERSGEDQVTDRSIEKRNRRGKRATRWTSEQEAAARQPGKEAMDVTTRSVSLAVAPSSQDVDGKGMGAQCTHVNPQRPETPRHAANDAAAATGPGEEAMDQMASGISLVKPTSSQMSDGSGDVEVHYTSVVPREHDDNASPNETAARGQGEDTVDRVADGGDVGVHHTSVVSQQPLANNRSAAKAAADAANPNTTSAGPTGPAGAPCRPAEGEPPSMPLEGGRDASRQVTSGHAEHLEQGAHKASRGEEDHARAKPPSSAHERHANCTTSDNPRVPDGIIEDPGGCVEPSTPEEPPSMPLEGEWAAQRRMSGACTGQQHGEGPHAWAEQHVSCAVSGTSRDVKRVETPLPAAVGACQGDQHVDKLRGDVPEPCTPPTKHPKRPVEPTNPPRRRGRLKTRPAKIRRSSPLVFPCLTSQIDMDRLYETARNAYWRVRGKPALPLVLHGHTWGVRSVAFLPDGNQVISGSDDGSIRAWRVGNGREVGTVMKEEGMVWAVAASSDGQWIATGGRDNKVRIWNAATHEKVVELEGHSDAVRSLDFTPDSARVVSGSDDNSVIVWSMTTRERLATLTGHRLGVSSVRVSPHGNHIASCGSDIRIWQIDSTELLIPPIKTGACSLAWTTDGRQLIAGCDSSIKIFDPSTGSLLAECKGHTSYVYSLAVSHNGNFFASASWDHTVRLWDSTTLQQIGPTLLHGSDVHAVAISPDGSHLVSGGDDANVRICIRNLTSCLFTLNHAF